MTTSDTSDADNADDVQLIGENGQIFIKDPNVDIRNDEYDDEDF